MMIFSVILILLLWLSVSKSNYMISFSRFQTCKSIEFHMSLIKWYFRSGIWRLFFFELRIFKAMIRKSLYLSIRFTVKWFYKLTVTLINRMTVALIERLTLITLIRRLTFSIIWKFYIQSTINEYLIYSWSMN